MAARRRGEGHTHAACDRHRRNRPEGRGATARARLPLSPEAGRRKVAVVTGASSGIGEATARELARRGWLCVLLARRLERLEALATELGGGFEVCDVADREQVHRAAAATLARHARIDLLVNNAGIAGRGDILTLEPERIEALLATNYLGGVWCTRAFLPCLGRGSHIVNVVSVAGAVALGPAGPYAASKHAQLAFSRSLSALLAPRGIAVHTILPGFVETEGFPQGKRLRGLAYRAVVTPAFVAERIVNAVEEDKRELFVPGWYRGFAVAQTLAPSLVARLARAGGRRPRCSRTRSR
ncbi:MAG: SDR family NAD(P)-dependent oxidoreductase [Gaiellaceae bacterium]